MMKLFKSLIKTVSIILLVIFIISPFVFRKWYIKQYHNVKGLRYVYIADKYFKKGELNNAVKFYNLGLKEYPEHSQARCNLANIYASYEDYSSAIEEYKTALKYNPKYMSCRMDLGLVLAETLSRYDEAIAEYRKVTETQRFPIPIPFVYDNVKSTKENKEYAYYNMGLAYRGKTIFLPREKLLNNSYLKDAIKSYNKALNINKKSYESLFNLALTHHLLGNTKEAGINYCRAIETEPMKYEAHLNLGILLDSLKYYPEAINEFQKAGLLIDDGDYETILYLNDLLNDSYRKDEIYKEVNKKRMMNYYYVEEVPKKKNFVTSLVEKFKKKKDDKKTVDQEEQNVILKKGKLVLKQEKENEFKRRMRKCDSKDIFKDM